MSSSSDVKILHLRLQLRHPRRIHHGQVFNTNLWTGQSELNLRWSHLHVDLTILLQPRPYLIAHLPENLDLEDRVDSDVRLRIVEVSREKS